MKIAKLICDSTIYVCDKELAAYEKGVNTADKCWYRFFVKLAEKGLL